ncbi:MAG: hypothetical protein ACREH9_01640 [Pseudomonadota bacterium]
MAAFAAFALAIGCRRAPAMRLHYLPGFVPGSERVFRPAQIAVVPVGGVSAMGRVRVGGVYAANGSLERPLYVEDFGRSITAAVIRALGDAGLKPVAAGPLRHGAASLPVGVEYVLNTSIEEASIAKRFGAEQTVHGQYFVMQAKVRLKFTLASRSNPDLYTGEMTGSEEEPPAPVGGEIFLPLETDPQESMSVALSRAVGALMLQGGFKDAFAAATPSQPPQVTPAPAPRASP